MKKKLFLLHVPVLFSAVLAFCELSGFPLEIHLTHARLFLILLTASGCAVWFLLFHNRNLLFSKSSVCSFSFQLCILIIVISAFLILFSPKLMSREGMTYTIGAFLHQARSFFFFLLILFLCIAVLIGSEYHTSSSCRLLELLSENTLIQESVLVFAACLLVFAAYIPLRDNYYPSHDYAIFSYFGQQILRGKIPYKELWDHKPPLIFYVNALGLKLFGGSLLGIWVLEFCAFYFGSLMLLRLLKKYFPKWIVLPVLSLGLLHYVRVLDFGNYTEELSLFFVICSLVLFFSEKRYRHPNLSGLLCGFFCGLAFTSKQNTIGCWCAFFLTDLIQIVTKKKSDYLYRQILRFWFFTGIGFLFINTGWVVYYAVHDALSAYWDIAFRFNFIYTDRSTDSRLACAWTTLTFLPTVSPFLALGFLGWFPACYSFNKKGGKSFIQTDPLTAWAFAAMPIELLFAGLSGMNYQHYFILCILPMIILLCSGLDLFSSRLHSANKLYRHGIILLLFIFSLPLYRCFDANYMHRTPSSYTKVRDYLVKETSADHPILVWGSRTAIYVMSERYAPTAYFNERPLYLFPEAIQEKQWMELLSDLQKDPPQVIIYTHDTALPFISHNGSDCSYPSGPAYTAAVYRYFCENYQYDTTINPEFYDAWDIFRYRNDK